jgi:hypothetical protein
MPTGPGGLDANGIWQYGEDDTEALASDLLNLGMGSVSTAVGGLGAPTILQVVSTTKTDTFSTTSTSFTDITGLTASTTPNSTSSKILVNITVSGIGTDVSNSGRTGFILVRDSTPIAIATGGSDQFTGHLSRRSIASSAFSLNSGVMTLDTPATTSSVTYKAQGKALAGTLYINRDADNVASVSSITLMEVAG